jgi:phenylpyruvate tautomerase PptA (4-oxalocrotonate tautomerase family)
MPYLQLDVNDRYSTDDKKRFAARLCDTYSRMMSVDIRRISIAIREVGEDGVWRMIDGEPVPVSVLMCDIRRGRPAEQLSLHDGDSRNTYQADFSRRHHRVMPLRLRS